MRQLSLLDYLALFLFSFVVTITVMTFIYPPIGRLDFSIYLVVSQLVLSHKPIYPLFIGNVLFPYTHPPTLVPFFVPFLFIPSQIATSVWNILSLLSLLFSVFLLLKISKVRLYFSSVLLILSAALLLEPVRETFLFGQNNTVVLLFLILSFFFSQITGKKYEIFSGISLGIAAALKLFPLFLLFYFLAKKQWANMIFAVITFFFFLVVGSLGNLSYVKQYIQYAHLALMPLQALNSDQSFFSFILFFFPKVKSFEVVITNAVYIFFILTSFLFWKKRKGSNFSDLIFFSQLLGSTILIVTPLAWFHHLVFLIPLTLVLLLEVFQTKQKKLAVFFIAIFILFFMSGDDVVPLLERGGLGYFPILYFHAIIGITFAIFGETIFSLDFLRKA